MPPIVPTVEPKVLLAGDTWQWYRNRADFTQFPSTDGTGGWTARYDFTGPTAFQISGSYQSGTAQDLFTAAAATTTAYLPGSYNWILRMVGTGTFAGQSFAVASGALTLLPNYATLPAAATHAQKALASIVAAIESRLSGDFESYSVAGRAITKIPIDRLIALRGRYEQEVWRERNPGTNGPKVVIQFNNAGT